MFTYLPPAPLLPVCCSGKHWFTYELFTECNRQRTTEYCSRMTVILKSNETEADALAGKVNLTIGLLLGRSEVLRSLRHYMRAQSQGHHTIDHLEERGVERGSASRSSLKGRERAIVNQSNIGTVSKVTLGKPLRDGAHMGFIERIDTTLN